MANTFVDPNQVVATALALFRDDMVLAQTVNRDYEADFGGGRGATVNVRVPAVLVARSRALDSPAAITMDDVTESTVPVALDRMMYSAVRINDEDLTLRITDFARQVLAPQVTALAESVEHYVAAEMTAVTEDLTIAYDATKPRATFTAARKKLRDLGMPTGTLNAACGTGVYTDLLNTGDLTSVATSGNDSVLRDGSVGRYAGFTVLESNRLADGTIVFYGRESFTLAVRAPVVPEGCSFGKSMAAEGFAIRWIKDYDASTLADRSICSTLIGVQPMPVKRLADDGTISTVTPAIRVDTTTIPALERGGTPEGKGKEAPKRA